MPDTAPRRIIKKYPNRRLYDTDSSAYITLAQVRQLVVDGAPVQVLDAKSGADITRSILLQIILEEEAAGAPMFSEAVLANIIRFYGHAMQGHMGSYLEKNVQMFADFQRQVAEQMPAPGTWGPFMRLPPAAAQGMLGRYLEQSQTLFGQMQEQMLAAMGMGRENRETRDKTAKT